VQSPAAQLGAHETPERLAGTRRQGRMQARELALPRGDAGIVKVSHMARGGPPVLSR
jgi:hypothetical protein